MTTESGSATPRSPATRPRRPPAALRAALRGDLERLLCAALLAATALFPAPETVGARQVDTTAASLVEQARVAGRQAADEREVWVNYGLPAPGMAVVGFGLPILLGEAEDLGAGDPESQLVFGGLVAAGAAFALAQWLPSGPTREQERGIADRPVEWQRAYRAAYEEHYRSRRMRATLWGAGGGAVVGLGFLLLVGIALASG